MPLNPYLTFSPNIMYANPCKTSCTAITGTSNDKTTNVEVHNNKLSRILKNSCNNPALNNVIPCISSYNSIIGTSKAFR